MSKKKIYLVLDCETATLPCVNDIANNAIQKTMLATTKPLIYDIGWILTDRDGKIYQKREFLISEIFSVPAIFGTAYYADKKPIYLKKLKDKKTQLMSWDCVMDILIEDMNKSSVVTAYNAMFDFRKAIPFTETYIRNLYSEKYYTWYEKQIQTCKNMVNKVKYPVDKNKPPKNYKIFTFRDIDYPLADLWSSACEKLINNISYKKMCLENEMISASGEFFKTSAETTFRYISKTIDFDENHTAIEDAEIETAILLKILKKGALPLGISFNPYQKLGTTTQFVLNKRLEKKLIEPVVKNMTTRINQGGGQNYIARLQKALNLMQSILDEQI